MKFHVRAGQEAWDVEIDGDTPHYGITIDGHRFDVDAADLGDNAILTMLLDHRSVLAHTRVVDTRRSVYEISIDGKSRKLEVLDALAAASRQSAGTAQRTGFDLEAPMPGLVVAVRVQPGDPVEAGASLVVMEAMKMQNELLAEAAGVVREVRVAVGQAVESGATLIVVGAA